MLRPFLSDQHLSAFGGIPLEYDRRIVLEPDVVTESLAYLTGSFINSGPQSTAPVSVLELGSGAAPFLTGVADKTSPSIALTLEGVDIDPLTLPYARYNVGQALGRRNNIDDTFSLKVSDWQEFLSAKSYDYIYFNPPFLSEGETVRERYQETPAGAMYVADSTDGLDHYRRLTLLLKNALNSQGKLVIRTPRDVSKAIGVKKVVDDAFGDEFVIHSVGVQSENGDRTGGGLVVDKTMTDGATHFKLGLIRTIGMGIVSQELVA
jgi:methylase of polypeptide subunit release factors